MNRVNARHADQPTARSAHDADLDDRGLAFDLGVVLNRRRALGMVGAGAAGVVLSACGGSARSSSGTTATSAPAGSTATTSSGDEIPDETAGPYPGDGSNGPDVLSQSGIVRRDIRSSFGDAHGTAEGIPMSLELNVTDLAHSGKPFAGVAVYVWHCDREGRYSRYSDGVTDQNYLRGVQIADQDGTVRFTSIFPACYSGRWPHIHFEVYAAEDDITDASKAIATSQVALPADVCRKVYATAGYKESVQNLAQVTLTSDNVFGDDAGKSQLAMVSGSVDSGLHVSLDVGVDTRTTPSSGGAPPAGGGPGGPGAPGSPGEMNGAPRAS